MEEQVKQTGQVALSEEEKKLNRQINYFIMRYMWQVIHGRGGDETIYAAFKMSRERYTRIMDTGAVSYRGNELDSLCARTGLNAKIFTGEMRFDCLAEKIEGQERRKTLVVTSDWKELFDLRAKRREQSQGLTILRRNLAVSKRAAEKSNLPKYQKEMEDAEKACRSQQAECERGQKKYKAKKDSICKALRESSRDNNKLLDDLYNFLEKDCLLKEERVEDVKVALRQLDFDILDSLDANQLKELRKMLKDTVTLIDGITIYKQAKKVF